MSTSWLFVYLAATETIRNNDMGDFLRYRLRSVGDFVTVLGVVKPLYGCSFAELEEFLERTDFLRRTVVSSDSSLSFEQIMVTDVLFKASVSRCLEMHGLSLGDVGLRQIQDLLLYEIIDEQLCPGLLIRINTPRDTAALEADTMALMGQDMAEFNRERALAVLATYTKSITEAVEITKIMTMQEVHNLMSESADINKASANSSESSAASTNDKDMLNMLDKYGSMPGVA
jgi:hypothetical protein